jgi:putative transposase
MKTPDKPAFFTATILEWKYLLENDAYKEIITDSLRFLVKQKRIKVYGYVIMPNHIHLIWFILDEDPNNNIQRDFLKFSSQKILADLKKNDPRMLKRFLVNASDRTYQVWERNPLSIELYSHDVMLQKLNYIHNNPLQEKWKLCEAPEDYRYSSARFYVNGKDEFGFLSHYDS